MANVRFLALALLIPPQPVTSLFAVVNADHSVTLDWNLPADPTVVGVTIFRDTLSSGETRVFVLDGPVTSFTDATAFAHEAYRYWVHTRDAEGDLSSGAWVEVGEFDCHCDGGASWFCVVGSAASAPAPGAALVGALVLALGALRLRTSR
jgi:hypothetical protein